MTRLRAAGQEPGPPGPAPTRGGRERGLPQPGDVIAGKYLVMSKLGEGGMAVVYEATHLRLHQRLAIKVLRPNIPEFEEVLARFEREARATAQLKSVHTARIVDVDIVPDGLPYIVMEFLEGVDLETELVNIGPMPFDEAADIVMQVADVMAEAHSLGIVHRDLKPANLYVCRVGGRRLIKVLDFGISKIEADGGARITRASSYFGTPCYAAPEQLRDAGMADPRSDVWSLGIILYEILTGRPPFEGTSTAVIAKVMVDPVPWPVERRPDLPPEMARVVMKALQRDPQARYQTMREFSDAMLPFGPSQKAATVVAEAQRSRGRLGEILVAEGLVSAHGLERALGEQKRTGKMLGRALLDLGLVTHADLLAALAKQQGVATTPPGRPDPVPSPQHPPTSSRSSTRGQRVWIAVALGVLGLLGVLGVTAAARSGHGGTDSAEGRSGASANGRAHGDAR